MNHEEWQAEVVRLAKSLAWSVLHVRRSIGKGGKWVTTTSITGFPDLFLFKPGFGCAAIELKVGRDKPTLEQALVLASLQAAGVRTLVAYPADAQAVVDLLTVRPAQAPVDALREMIERLVQRLEGFAVLDARDKTAIKDARALLG